MSVGVTAAETAETAGTAETAETAEPETAETRETPGTSAAAQQEEAGAEKADEWFLPSDVFTGILVMAY